MFESLSFFLVIFLNKRLIKFKVIKGVLDIQSSNESPYKFNMFDHIFLKGKSHLIKPYLFY